MKKPTRTGNTGKSPLTLNRDHIRLLTPTDLQQAVGGKEKPTESSNCTTSSKIADTCA